MATKIDRAMELFSTVDGFGVMHTAVEDGNLDDNHLAGIEELMKTEKHGADEKELLDLLRSMEADERYAAWDAINDNHG